MNIVCLEIVIRVGLFVFCSIWNGRSVVMETVLIAIEYYRVNFLSGVESV